MAHSHSHGPHGHHHDHGPADFGTAFAIGITLNLGFSHPIQYRPPKGITVEVPSPTTLTVQGADKQIVGQVAADLRAFRPPEPYKGKGIRYQGEQVRRKAGKTAGA